MPASTSPPADLHHPPPPHHHHPLSPTFQAYLNSIATAFQLTSTVVLVVVVATLGSRNNPGGRTTDDFVWKTYFNDSGFTSPSGVELYVGLLGLLLSLFSFAGYEAGGHAAEETLDSARSAPFGIIMTCVSVAVCGLAYILALLYSVPYGACESHAHACMCGAVRPFVLPTHSCSSSPGHPHPTPTPHPPTPGGLLITDAMVTSSTDPLYIDPSVVDATPYIGMDYGVFRLLYLAKTANPVVDIFYAVAGKQGALGLTLLVTINLFFAGMASLTVTSRIIYAMARDHALPFSTWTSQIWSYNKCPVNTVLVVLGIDLALLLLPLATMNVGDNSPLAFNAVTGLTCIGFQISYAIPLWQCAVLGDRFVRGPVHMGALSVPMAYVSAIFLTFTSAIFFWPTIGPSEAVTADNMNYVCVVVAGVAVIAGLYWWVHGYKLYRGPKRAAHSARDLTAGLEFDKTETTETASTPI